MLRPASLAALLLAGRAAPATAQPRPAALHWVRLPGAEGCADGRALARAIEALVGRDAIAPASRADLALEGTIAPREGAPGWRVVVTPRGPDGAVGVREFAFEQADCAAVTEPVALMLSLIVDPEGCAQNRCEAPDARVAAPPTQPPAAPPSAPRDAPLPRLTALVGGGFALAAVLPDPLPAAAAAGITWRPGRLPLSFDATAEFVPPGGAPWGESVTVRAWAALATVSACASPFRDHRLFGCAGLAAGVAGAEAEGAARATTATSLLLAASARVGFELPLSERLTVRFAPGVVVPLVWPRYTLNVPTGVENLPAARDVSPVAPVGYSFEAMIGWRFLE